MTNIQLLSVCFRAFGIYLAFSTLPLFLAFFANLNVVTFYGPAVDPYSYFSWMSYLASPVLVLVLASILFFAPEKFARNLLSDDVSENHKSDWSADQLQAVAFSTVGLYLLASALVNAHDWIAIIRVFEHGMEYAIGARSMVPPPPAFIIEHVLKLAVGVFLLFGAGGLSNLVSSWRKARIKPLASDADREPATEKESLTTGPPD